jgi:hypothetical protein
LQMGRQHVKDESATNANAMPVHHAQLPTVIACGLPDISGRPDQHAREEDE